MISLYDHFFLTSLPGHINIHLKNHAAFPGCYFGCGFHVFRSNKGFVNEPLIRAVTSA